MKFNSDDVRIVAANQHHESGEIEIVIEVSLPNEERKLASLWIDKAEVFERIDKYFPFN